MRLAWFACGRWKGGREDASLTASYGMRAVPAALRAGAWRGTWYGIWWAETGAEMR
jgi:hypothetical protein